MGQLRIGIEDRRVIVEIGDSTGSKFAMLTWEQAEQFAAALRTKAKELEEAVKIDDIIQDGAVLFRAGVPIGLTNNRDAQKEIVKEAITNRALRRSNLVGVKSKAMPGVPSLKQLAPDATLQQRVEAMTQLEKAHLRRLLDKERGN